MRVYRGWLLILLWWGIAACGTREVAATARAEAPALSWVVWSKGEGDLTQPMPMILAIHGRGDTPESFVRLFAQHPGPIRVIAPRAPIPWGRGASWFSSSSREASEEDLVAEMRTRSGELAALVRSATEAYPTQGEPVVTGFSQGGMLSFAFAIEHPELVAGAVPVSGYLPLSMIPEAATEAHRQTPVRALHGTADPVLALEPVTHAVRQMQARGFDAQLKSYPGVEHSIDAAMRRDLFAWLRGMVE